MSFKVIQGHRVW